jgi:hypothetical protein
MNSVNCLGSIVCPGIVNSLHWPLKSQLYFVSKLVLLQCRGCLWMRVQDRSKYLWSWDKVCVRVNLLRVVGECVF